MPKKNQHFMGYQGPTNLNIAVPPKIKCSRCDIVKGSSAFSNRNLDNLKDYIVGSARFNPTTQGVVPCAECTGAQRLEHTCCDCGKTKATDTGFTKTQLRRGEDALCIKCSDRLNNLGAGGKEADDDDGEEAEEEDGDSGAESTGGTSDYAESEWASTSGVPVPSTSGQTVVTGGTFPSRSGIKPLYSSFVRASTQSNQGTAASTSSMSTAGKPNGLPPGFNPNVYRQPSTPGGDKGSRGRGNPGFAKIRAAPRTDHAAKPGRKRVVEDEDEDEDDELIHSGDSDF